MAVKGKQKICQTSLIDFNVEQINDSPFYKRYGEFLRVFKKHITSFDYEIVFAEPVENAFDGSIDWYIPNTQDKPVLIERLKGTENYEKYNKIRKDVIEFLFKKLDDITNPQEQKYLKIATNVLKGDYLDNITFCVGNSISFVAWGIYLRKGKNPATVITDDVRDHRTHKIEYTIDGSGVIGGNKLITRRHGHILKGDKDIPEIIPDKHFSFVRWLPDAPHGKEVVGDIKYIAVCERTEGFFVNFKCSEGGHLEGNLRIEKKEGENLLSSDIPITVNDDGFEFDRWEPDIQLDNPIEDDCVFTALFKEKETRIDDSVPLPPNEPEKVRKYTIKFDAGENGELSGEDIQYVSEGDCIDGNSIPLVKPKKGYKFKGWDSSTDRAVYEDITYHALYDKKSKWYSGFFSWITGLFTLKGCLKWLLWLLLLLCICLLLTYLLRSCVGCTGGIVGGGDEYGTGDSAQVIPIDTVKGPDDKYYDDNGQILPITNDGTLPVGDRIVSPVRDKERGVIPIIEQPGLPSIIANRLFLFMEDGQDSVEELAKDFKKAYPEDKYSIIGYDKEVKMIVVQVPEDERDYIRNNIHDKIPNHNFIVFDEEIYELNGSINEEIKDAGWHLEAIHLKEGWQITSGDKNVRVAIVDDGIESQHPMFKGRIIDAYNVYTQNNKLSMGEGHGTHTAGLAVGNSDYFSKGASGVAPNCLLIPVQVFDNGRCPLSAIVAGVMYAVHHDADVINVSIGPSFPGLNELPIEMQNQISQQQFRNVEKLWTRVSEIVAKKNSILVFAAGNDNILSSIPPENRNSSSLVVTAVDKNLYPTDFTNYGPGSDISAPGKDIFSSYPQGDFKSFDGTSMSAPIVSGVIALMKSVDKNITIEQVRNVLLKSGDKVHGNIPPMVRVDKALECVQKRDYSAPDTKELVDSTDQKGNSGIIDLIETPDNSDQTDYEAIRNLIKKYEAIIADLKKQLPENKQ